ncbi:hypothetical protein V1517DRAFT_370141 [Lipomyces orientalis]|uniref:Uncharacterized protein n=1 Tax=Lipomyces orientalis TaxID=1233043 RepID=A0ACC3TFH6_9ASCO
MPFDEFSELNRFFESTFGDSARITAELISSLKGLSMEIFRRPLSPEVEVGVQASGGAEVYNCDVFVYALLPVKNRYPRLLYDGTKNVAIVAAPPSRLHSNMVGGLLTNIICEVSRNQGIVEQRGRTTRRWDGVILCQEPNRSSLIVAVEVGVSQSYESLRAAISWSVCALHCRLGIVRWHGPDPPQHSSIQVENAAVDESEAEQDFRRQLTERPYGPLVRDGVAGFGRIKRVALETYRISDEDVLPELHPLRSFATYKALSTIVEEGEFVGGDVPPNLQEVVLGDCIPDHILSREAMVAMPVKFKDGMVSTAGNRMRPRPE